MPLPLVLRAFWIASVAAFFLMCLLAWFQARRGDPYWDPLGFKLYEDLVENMPTFGLVHTASFWSSGNPLTPPVAYPPFAAVLMGLLYATGDPKTIYTLIAAVAIFLACWWVRRALLLEGIARYTALLFPFSIAAMSFPFEALLQRGNVELFLWIFAAGGVWAFLRGQEEAAAILWSLAAAMKLYPILYLVLFLPRRQYRSLLLGLTSFVVLSLASMAYLGPTIRAAWSGSLHSVFGYQAKRVGEWDFAELVANHSAFTWVKTVALISGHSPVHLPLPYYACGGLLFALLFFGRLQHLPMANQLLGVSVWMVLLPPVSYSHTLVHLYAPWLLLIFLAVQAASRGVHVPGLSVTILLFLPAFASFTLFSFPQALLYGGLIQSTSIAALMLCAVRFPFPQPVNRNADALREQRARLPRGGTPTIAS